MQKTVIEGFQLSPQQKHLWLVQQNKQAYTGQCAIKTRGKLDTKILRKVLQDLIHRHEILHTTFQCLPGMDLPIQVLIDNPVLSYQEVDVSGWDFQKQETKIEEIFGELHNLTFDFEQGPLVHFCLIILSATEHILNISLSSLCADAWTLKNLMYEINQFYAAHIQGEELLHEPLQYVQFSEWQNELLEGNNAEQGREYWCQQQLSDILTLPIPFEGKLYKKFESIPGASAPESTLLVIDSELTKNIKAVAEKYNTSTSVFLLACWQVMLWRLTGQPDIVINNLFDNRKYEDLHKALGLFAKYLPIYGRIETNFKFSEVLEKVHRSVNDAYVWQEYFTWEECQETIEDSRESTFLPICFDFEEWPIEKFDEVQFSMYRQYICIDHFKLRLSAVQVKDCLNLRFSYEPTLYLVENIQRLAGEFQALLKSVIEKPESLVGKLDILSKTEKHQLLVEWNDTNTEYPQFICIHELFESQVERTPNAIAVVFEKQQLSYQELNQRANQLAHYLRRHGVETETLVALCMERSVDMIVGLLGILKAGGAYLPLDPMQPKQRLAFMLENAQVRMLLTQEKLMASLPQYEVEVLCLDSDWETIMQESEVNLKVNVSPDNLAYVIYTSGSTGQPKGVMIQHNSVVNLSTGLYEAIYAHQGRSLKVSLNAPLAFDASVKQIIQLLKGHTLYILSEEVRRDGNELLSYLSCHSLDVFDCTPSQLKLLLAAGLIEKPELIPAVVLVGGEVLNESTWQFLKDNSGNNFYNVYGPTECTVDATVSHMQMFPTQPTIGRPISNTQIYLLNNYLQPVPIGVIGELYVSGAGLARGYLQQPKLTAEKFIPNPFSQELGARLYKTGDLARYLHNGYIEFVDRIDHQVKIRGFRIELGEIESLLTQHPGVREAVVQVREDEDDQKRLVAYVVPKRKYASTIDGRTRYKLPNGIAIVHQNKNETDYLYEEIFEKQTYFKHGIILFDGACVFDVGSNIGMFTLFVNQHFRDVRVYAFEPIAPIFETLRLNVELYGFNVKLFQLGLSNEEKIDTFMFYPRYSMMSGIDKYANAQNEVQVIKKFMFNEQQNDIAEETGILEHADALLEGRFEGEIHQCRLRTFSDLIHEEGVEHIDLLKIDVQRAELDVLKGIKEQDWEKIQQIVIEVHDGQGEESEGRVDEIVNLLKSHGYEAVAEQDELLRGTDRYNLYAIRPQKEPYIGNKKHQETTHEWQSIHPDTSVLSATEIRSFLKEHLPEYMVPTAFVLLDKLPLTRNGKIDREALPAPDKARPEEKVFVAPHTVEQKVLADIWAQVLRFEQLGIDDNFFELGGDSIRSIQVQALARKRGLNFSIQQLFQHQTIRGLAQELTATNVSTMATQQTHAFDLISEEERLKLPDKVEDAYPLTMLQIGMLFHSDYMPDIAMYHNVNSLHIKAPFSFEKMRTAIQQLMARHPVLRSSFNFSNFSEPLQLIHQIVDVPLQIEDLRHLSFTEQEEILAAHIEDQKNRKFDWNCAPLIRFHIHCRSQETFQFTWAEHHAILDGWSLASMIAELFQLYFSYLREENHSVEPPPTLTFRDFVALERKILKSGEHQNYWIQKLSDSTVSMLPRWSSHHQKTDVRQTRAQEVVISPDVCKNLHKLAQSAGVPLKSVLLTAHLRVLSLLIGQQDVVTGLVSNGRLEEADGDRVFGLFLNTLPFRLKIPGDTWIELVQKTFEAERELLPFRRYPMAKLQNILGGQPLFETLFNFTHMHVLQSLREFKEMQILGQKSIIVDTNFTLAAYFDVDPSSSHIKLRLDCDTTQLCDEQSQAIADYYARTLAAMSSEPFERHEYCSLLSQEERHQLLLGWNNTRVDDTSEQCLHELFEAQVIRTPYAVAVVSEDKSLTYQDLNSQANQLAHYLQKLGVEPEVLVGICVERSLEMVVGLLGILKAGGAYVPLDPTYPKEQLAFMLEDAQVSILLTQERLIEGLPEHRAEIICLDTSWEDIARGSIQNPASSVTFGNLAYVIYTSGSTGRSKGVTIEHHNTVALLNWARTVFTPEDLAGVLASTSICFDLSVFELFVPISIGGKVILAGNVLQLPMLSVAKDVTLLNTVPSAMTELLRLNSVPASVRTINLAGEPLQNKLVQQVYQQETVRQIFNLYGPSEDTTYSTFALIGKGSTESPTIGHPIANTQIYLLDAHLQPVPVGVPGELYISGAGLARGYLNRHDLTAEKFIPNPFSDIPGTRLYSTGDVARYLPKGSLEFLGRLDYQVKIRGYRIELGQIEAVLSQHPAIWRTVVIARKDVSGDKRLVAYVVPHSEQAPVSSELHSFLQEKLPGYMIPSAFVILDALPLTPNGKLDRNALPAPGRARPKLENVFVAPRTPEEELLAEIWSKILNVEQIGIHDNFFELGGHSLLATQVIYRVREAFQTELPLRSLFEASTIADLAVAVKQNRSKHKGESINVIGRANRENEEQLLAKLDQLSDAEVDSMLMDMLAEKEVIE